VLFPLFFDSAVENLLIDLAFVRDLLEAKNGTIAQFKFMAAKETRSQILCVTFR